MKPRVEIALYDEDDELMACYAVEALSLADNDLGSALTQAYMDAQDWIEYGDNVEAFPPIQTAPGFIEDDEVDTYETPRSIHQVLDDLEFHWREMVSASVDLSRITIFTQPYLTDHNFTD